MKENRDKQIIKALKRTDNISQIAKLAGVTRIYIYWRLKNNKEYQHARELHLTSVLNVFES